MPFLQKLLLPTQYMQNKNSLNPYGVPKEKSRYAHDIAWAALERLENSTVNIR